MKQDVDAAVTAASIAFPSWAALSNEKRAQILHKFADLMERDAERLAHLEAVCNVKPVKLFCEYELPQAVKIFRCKASLAENLEERNNDSNRLRWLVR